MVDKVLITFLVSELLFVLGGGLLLGFAVIMQHQMAQPASLTNVSTNMLLGRAPMTGAIANAVFVFIASLLSLPAVIVPQTHGWLKAHGYMVVFCALFTLVLGLDIWFDTLKTRSNLSAEWSNHSADIQSLLQQKFACCGYDNSTSPPFVLDSTCTSAIVAAGMIGCVVPLSNFVNNYLDVIFTAAFGIVGVDAALILAIAMLLKDRKEKVRYRHIDLKSSPGGL